MSKKHSNAWYFAWILKHEPSITRERDSLWKREDGTTYTAKWSMSLKGTGYNGFENIKEMIDFAEGKMNE